MWSLSKELNGKRWFSTQENNALYLAARTLQTAQGQSWQATVDGDAQPVTGNAPLNRGLEAQKLAQGVTVSNPGAGVLYGNLNVVGYPLTPPAPVSQQLAIKQEYFTLDGKAADLSNLRSGELLVVRLTLSARRDISDALVVDLLPAGLELENQNLAGSSASLGDSADALKESMIDMQQVSIRHIEFRDDRFVAALVVDSYRPATLIYLAQAVTLGTYTNAATAGGIDVCP